MLTFGLNLFQDQTLTFGLNLFQDQALAFGTEDAAMHKVSAAGG